MRVLVKTMADLDPERVKVDPGFYRETAGIQFSVFEVDKDLTGVVDVFWTDDRKSQAAGGVVYGISPEDVDTLWVEECEAAPPRPMMEKITTVYLGRLVAYTRRRWTLPCDCGAAKAKTTHAHWCSTRQGRRP